MMKSAHSCISPLSNQWHITSVQVLQEVVMLATSFAFLNNAVTIVSISIGRPAKRSTNIDDWFRAVFLQTSATAFVWKNRSHLRKSTHQFLIQGH